MKRKRENSFVSQNIQSRELTNLGALPDELFLKIFSFFSFKTLSQVELVSRKFHSLSRDESLWKSLVHREISINPQLRPNQTYKQYYQFVYVNLLQPMKLLSNKYDFLTMGKFKDQTPGNVAVHMGYDLVVKKYFEQWLMTSEHEVSAQLIVGHSVHIFEKTLLNEVQNFGITVDREFAFKHKTKTYYIYPNEDNIDAITFAIAFEKFKYRHGLMQRGYYWKTPKVYQDIIEMRDPKEIAEKIIRNFKRSSCSL